MLLQKKVNHDVEKLFSSSRGSPQSNLTAGERQAIEWLKNNDEIVVRGADKGGATIVWGKTQYIDESLRQLNDTHYYVPLSSNPI